MKKSTLLMVLSLVLALTIGLGTTLAYLTDTDSDVNVMTLGNVDIEQIEQERDEYGELQDYTQGKPLYPAVGTPDHYVDQEGNKVSGTDDAYKFLANADDENFPNAQDKIVTVKNIGKSDAYVRTIIAFEVVEDVAEVKSPGTHIGLMRNNGENRGNATEGDGNTDWYWNWLDDVVTIDEKNYAIAVVTHKEVLEAGDTTIPSLLQVYLKKEVDNEYVAELGETYDILVVSQAVQAAGFEDAETALNEAFGEVSTTSHPWMKEGEEGAQPPYEDKPESPIVLTEDGDGLVAALETGKDVLLTDTIKIDPASMSNAYGATGINIKNGQTLDGNGNTIDISGANGTWDSGINTTGGIIRNVTVTGSFRGIFINHNSTHSEPVILDNVTLKDVTYTISCDQGLNQTLTANDSKFYGWTSFAATLGNATFNNCYFGEGNDYAYCRPYAPTEFNNCEFEAGYTLDARAAVVLNNCYLDGELITEDNLANLVTSSTIAKVSVK